MGLSIGDQMLRNVTLSVALLVLLSPGCAKVNSLAASANSAPSAASTSGLKWTTFVDPAEHAFSLEVPRGWTVKGALFRLGYSDERPMVNMTSPDGSIQVRLGDVSIPTYTLPNPLHSREGETYDLGAQAQMVVARYRSGPEFAILYSHARFHQLCRNPQADAEQPDLAADYIPSSPPPDQTSSGQIAYACDSGQTPQAGSGNRRIAFAYVRTSRFGNIWQAAALGSFLAPADKVAEARMVLMHSAKSFQLLPAWTEYQKRMDATGLQYQRVRQQQRRAALAQQVQQFEAQMHAMQQQVNAFERHQAAQAAQVEGFTNVLNGITPTTDPLTGESRIVWTGPSNRYWANGLGQVVNSNTMPSPGMLESLPNHQ